MKKIIQWRYYFHEVNVATPEALFITKTQKIVKMIALQIHSLPDQRKTIERWLNLPHVAEWWGDPTERLEQFDTTSPDNHALIIHDGIPIGYVRWERVCPKALTSVGLTDIPDGSFDIDIFIGDLDAVGRGAGPKALELLFDHLRVTTEAPLAGLCSSIFNDHAHAAFLKAGCIRSSEFDDPVFGKCVVFARHLR
jgi:RimJ/RimL family protein N-acetyltransferase